MEGLLQINRTAIEAGLDREYRFFQISDAHITCTDSESTELDLAEYELTSTAWRRMAKHFADEFGEFYDERYERPSKEMFEIVFAHAREFRPDAIILSGDVMNRVTDSNIRYLEKFLAGCDIPVIYTPGNHEAIDEVGVHKKMYERLTPLIPSPAFDTFDVGGIRIVTVDDGEKNVTETQLEALKREIAGDKPLLLVLHAPLGVGEFADRMKDKLDCAYFLIGVESDSECDREFARLITENDERFLAILAGHIHTSVEYRVTDKLMQYTTSSALIGHCREIIIR